MGDARMISVSEGHDGQHRHETWMELMTDLLFVSLAYNCGSIIKSCGVKYAFKSTWIPFFSCYQVTPHGARPRGVFPGDFDAPPA